MTYKKHFFSLTLGSDWVNNAGDRMMEYKHKDSIPKDSSEISNLVMEVENRSCLDSISAKVIECSTIHKHDNQESDNGSHYLQNF